MGSSSSERVRTRAQRVASRVDYRGISKRCKEALARNDGGRKLALLLLVSLVVSVLCGSWDQPLGFKLYSVPDRDVVCNTNFSAVDLNRTEENRKEARANAIHYYVNDPSKLVEFKKELRREIQTIVDAPSFDESEHARKILRKYLPDKASKKECQETFDKLKAYFEDDVELAYFVSSLDRAFKKYEKTGILVKLHSLNEGNQEQIKVYQSSRADEFRSPPSFVERATRGSGDKNSKSPELEEEDDGLTLIDEKLGAEVVPSQVVLFGNGSDVRAQLNDVFNHDSFIVDRLMTRVQKARLETLVEDRAQTVYAQEKAARGVGKVSLHFKEGGSIVSANNPIGDNEYRWLQEERKSYLAHNRGPFERVMRWGAMFFLTTALFFGSFLFMCVRKDGADARFGQLSVKETALYLFFLVAFFAVARILQTAWPDQGMLVEMVPILVFVELSTFALSWSVALTVGVILSFALTVSGGSGFDAFIVYFSTIVFVAFTARNVKTRVELVYLALGAGVCAFVVSTSAGLLMNDYMRPTSDVNHSRLFLHDVGHIVMIAFYRGLWGALAGVLTTCVLPLVELYLRVVTPMQLLEYANPSHPLMLELSRRAPATYNHSIQTATLAEAAAEAIGARAYLAKVGAYFHDVGKLLNPEYFTENQNGHNIHDELEPRMSALVIVAHVKDGVDLGRRYNLPQQIIDLTEQHHGTMLVGFFYAKALKAAQESNPDAKLDEAPFRYPGPIPQTKEAGILMLADAAESASRSLAEWTPRRVENLVRKITEARIEDGQFRDSGLTFGEIQIIQQSLVTSLLASRHSRVKYPDEKNEKDARDGDRRDDSRIVVREPRDDDSKIVRRDDGSKIVKLGTKGTDDSSESKSDGKSN